MIQRQLEEVEEKQRALEEKGVTLEKVLRGETGTPHGQMNTFGNAFNSFIISRFVLTCPLSPHTA